MSRQEVTQLRRQTRELAVELNGLADDIARELKELPPLRLAAPKLSNVVRPPNPGMKILEPARKAPDFSPGGADVGKALKLTSRIASRGREGVGRGMLELHGGMHAARERLGIKKKGGVSSKT